MRRIHINKSEKHQMNNSKIKINEKLLHTLLLILIFTSAIYSFSFFTADPDLWGHIKFGQDTWEQGALHRVDPYSYTAVNHEWINHEWLSEILMFLVWDNFGSPGLLAMKMLMGLLIVFILTRMKNRL